MLAGFGNFGLTHAGVTIVSLAETDLHSLLGGQGRAEPDILATGLDSVDEAVLPADATLPSGVLSI